ncbi:MAG: hypothetical protein KAS92_00605 [Candidatus Omnitrophica bacterium]|nr:hypothetical protein [Candidatus Omnitrophota bacterium]MCK5178674.1 hypothetical protein [Candidatus Omnitrophota bacterium]
MKTKEGQEIGFNYLVIATGSKPIIPALSSINAQDVFSVRSGDILGYQYSTHPKLAAKPSDNVFVNAAKNVLTKLKESVGEDCPIKG